MKNYSLIFSGLLFLALSSTVYADPPKPTDTSKNTQPTISPDSWNNQSKAVLRVLNKLESSVNVLTIPVNGSAQYKTLTISVKKCLVRPSALAADSTAFVTITDSKLSTNPFSAWIFKAEPGASVFEHPLYNVSLVGCSGETTNAPVSTQPTEPNPNKPAEQKQPNSLEDSLEQSIQSQH